MEPNPFNGIESGHPSWPALHRGTAVNPFNGIERWDVNCEVRYDLGNPFNGIERDKYMKKRTAYTDQESIQWN
jgi:hypothetical protein